MSNPPTLCLHFLSDTYQNAERISSSKVAQKVRAGGVWYRLVSSFCSAGGAAAYSRALVLPDGALALVSDRAPGMDGLMDLPALEVQHTLLKLDVPFEEKDQARALGATWISHRKTWACAPWRAEEFSRWVKGEPQVFDLLEAGGSAS